MFLYSLLKVLLPHNAFRNLHLSEAFSFKHIDSYGGDTAQEFGHFRFQQIIYFRDHFQLYINKSLETICSREVYFVHKSTHGFKEYICEEGCRSHQTASYTDGCRGD